SQMVTQVNETLSPFQLKVDAVDVLGKITVATNDRNIIKVLKYSDILDSKSGQKILQEASQLIISMGQVDQNMRLGKQKYDIQQDQKHIKTLKAIIKKIGWPTVEKVGQQSSHYAWLLVQHADFDLAFQKTVLKFLSSLKASPSNRTEVAFLSDKILIQECKKQIYGTQFKVDKDKNIIPEPIENYKSLDQRRKEFHLEPFKTYLSKLYSIYGKKK
ncbi:hypothetical protein MJH12_15505, partial [bacterium]|nr:hypothetical protein [bacterium]